MEGLLTTSSALGHTSPTRAGAVNFASYMGNLSATKYDVFQIPGNLSTLVVPTTDATDNSTEVPDYACYSITQHEDNFHIMLSHRIFLYASFVLVIVGLIGNTLSVLVFTSREMRTISSNFYLLMLAVSDSCYLLSVFLSKVLTDMRCLHMKDTSADIYHRFNMMCKLLQYTSDVFSDYSTCLILVFTIERFIAVYLPLKFKEICTLTRAKIVCLGLLLVISISTCPYHMIMVGLYQDFPVCIVLLEHENLFAIFYLIEAVCYRIIPVILIAGLNAFIIFRVIHVSRAKRNRRRAQNSLNNNTRSLSKKEDKNRQLTIMLILVSSTYILTYLPVLVHYILWKLQRMEKISLSSDGMMIAQNYSKTLYIAGFATNFFLYTVSGKVFRKQLIFMLCGQKKYIKTETSAVEMTTVVKEM